VHASTVPWGSQVAVRTNFAKWPRQSISVEQNVNVEAGTETFQNTDRVAMASDNAKRQYR
jgi:hypothetical protein